MLGAAKGSRLGGSSCNSKRKREKFKTKYISSENTIKKGDIVDVSQLLFTQHRDYLIKYNHPESKVQAKHLEGKFIVLHFVPLLPKPDFDIRLRHIRTLVDIYNQIQPNFGFEVIFVPITRPKFVETTLKSTLHKRFKKLFALMPWTAIPLSDVKSRKNLATRFQVYRYMSYSNALPRSFVIDPTGLVLQCPIKDEYLFKYGSQGFPFSKERFKCILAEDNEAKNHPSITKLLTSPGRDYVINKDNQMVPVDNLKDKVVAFYFYEDRIGKDPCSVDLTQEIKILYTQLADKGNFEVVLVHIHDYDDEVVDEDSYRKTLNTMPWLALPFKDPRCKQLQRIVDYPPDLEDPPDPRLAIFDPQNKVLEPYAVHILFRFRADISAFPFTRQRAVELETEFLKKIKLDMLFDPDTTCCTQIDGTEKKYFSQVVGKNIILIIGNICHTYHELWEILTTKYFQMKGTIDEFEVIRVPEDNPDSGAANKPWLRRHHHHHHCSKEYSEGGKSPLLLCHPACRSGTSNMFLRLFDKRLVAFDRDGSVVSKTMFPQIQSKNMKFPFYSRGLEEDVLREMICLYAWWRRM